MATYPEQMLEDLAHSAKIASKFSGSDPVLLACTVSALLGLQNSGERQVNLS